MFSFFTYGDHHHSVPVGRFLKGFLMTVGRCSLRRSRRRGKLGQGRGARQQRVSATQRRNLGMFVGLLQCPAWLQLGSSTCGWRMSHHQHKQLFLKDGCQEPQRAQIYLLGSPKAFPRVRCRAQSASRSRREIEQIKNEKRLADKCK